MVVCNQNIDYIDESTMLLYVCVRIVYVLPLFVCSPASSILLPQLFPCFPVALFLLVVCESMSLLFSVCVRACACVCVMPSKWRQRGTWVSFKGHLLSGILWRVRTSFATSWITQPN